MIFLDGREVLGSEICVKDDGQIKIQVLLSGMKPEKAWVT